MKLLTEEKHELQGLTVHTVQTTKYKTNTLILKLNAPLNEETVTKRALLPYVLQSATEKFPTTTKLRSYLDDLYGATLQVDLTKKGDNHDITIRVDIANEKYLKDHTPLLKKALALIGDILLNPALEETAFLSDIVTKEKRALRQRIQAVFDDKMRYANLRLVEEMCKEEPYSLHVNGRIDDIEQITPESLYDYYKQVLKEDAIHLYIIGDIQAEEVLQTVKETITLPTRQLKKPSHTAATHQVEKVNEVVEKQNIKQGKLNIGYRTNIVYGDRQYFALQVFNGIFGAFSHSKLFMNVREKASLAYYVGSRVESHKGLLMVMSGIDAKNFDQAVTIIKDQMDEMRNGTFSEEEIAQTKAVIHNQLLETIDTPRGLVEVLYHNELTGAEITIDGYLKGIDAVSTQDIVKVAENIQMDTIYFLTGTDGE
ncbi:EF-P 5-aminopentanol modification-associated protein YfmF [Metabacillus iocasae]|uniref:Zn-dependent peptidase n=1 Tax=Priestia iocasae TaxID=2291674 RepID=A0ABS2QRA5_9BACI|nr:pitrilysin family protein [Metabacillus iocasae]MBM7701930.1 putative Zn-dependent peptidase [Metabacillus iocasae]